MKNLIVLTAFGAFGDVSCNPTQEMVQEFQNELNAGFPLDQEQLPIIFKIIPVSVADCLLALQDIRNEILTLGGIETIDKVLFIHLGIDANAQFMKMEQFGYNNMTFRIPDVRGYQPSGECINSICEFNAALQTSYKLSDILEIFRGKFPNFISNSVPSVSDNLSNKSQLDSIYVNDLITSNDSMSLLQISSDPGRYLCNYLYYQSLTFSSSQSHGKCHSLFIHVPPFNRISKDIQKTMLVEIISLLLQHCQ